MQDSFSGLVRRPSSCKSTDVATAAASPSPRSRTPCCWPAAPTGNGRSWTVQVAKDDNGGGNDGHGAAIAATTPPASPAPSAEAKTYGGNHGTSVSGTVYVVCLKKS
ncbi:hypothetical protein [Nonomuraea dietziae]|uniref:hypothetical protein n=1 Tax=Nonomuraea dietziae TaxID=65515 RepID=UPI0031D95547